MDKLIYTAMTGAKATLDQQAAVAHNLSNVATSGFRAELHKLRAVPVLTQAFPSRAFVVDASVSTDYSQGPQMETGKITDVAIQGRGWFAIQMPDGTEAYTRNGSFDISANGVLQTKTGRPVVGDGGPIAIPPNVEVSIGADGVVSTVPSTGPRNNTNPVARLKLVDPPEQDLVRGEDGYFRLRSRQPAPLSENVKVASGYLEGSNVNVAEQMVTMISLARQFEMQTKMLQNAQENDRSASQILAKG